MEKQGNVFVCSLCRAFGDSRASAIVIHVCQVHASKADEPCQNFNCGFEGCNQLYSTRHTSSYRSHYYSHHFIRNQRRDQPPTLRPLDQPDVLPAEMDEMIYIDSTPQVYGDFKMKMGEFVLRCLEERKLTQRAMNGITEDVSKIWKLAMDALEVALRSTFPECTIPPGDLTLRKILGKFIYI